MSDRYSRLVAGKKTSTRKWRSSRTFAGPGIPPLPPAVSTPATTPKPVVREWWLAGLASVVGALIVAAIVVVVLNYVAGFNILSTKSNAAGGGGGGGGGTTGVVGPSSSSSSAAATSSASSSSSTGVVSILGPTANGQLWSLPLTADYNDVVVTGTAAIIKPAASCLPYFAATLLPSGVAGQAWYNLCSGGNGNGLMLPYTNMTNSYTLEVWYLINSSLIAGGDNAFMGACDNLGSYGILPNVANSNNTHMVLVNSSGVGNCNVAPTATLAWTHLAMTYNDTTSNYTFYYNGVQACTFIYASVWDTLPGQSPCLGGNAVLTPLRGFYLNYTGWNHARTAAHIHADYVGML